MVWLVTSVPHLKFCETVKQNSRDHFLEALQRLLDIGAGGHIVLYSFDEWSVWDATLVRGGVLAVWDVISMARLLYRTCTYPSFSCSVILCSNLCFVDVILEATPDWTQA
jgi:hypothetical protein